VIRRGSTAQAISTFNVAYNELKEAIRRSAEIEGSLDAAGIEHVTRARRVLEQHWPFLEPEGDLSEAEQEDAKALDDLLARETFFRELPEIEQRARSLEKAYETRRTNAIEARSAAYEQALETLRATPGWNQLNDDQRQHVSETLTERTKAPEE